MLNALKSASNYLVGFFLSTAIASPAEWMVHRYMLHPKSRNFINRSSGVSHNDIHHGAYKGPEHYYRDMSNAHEIIHFSPKWVAIIHTTAAGLGLAVHEGLTKIPQLQSECEGHQNAFVGGFLTGTALYYAVYEGLHHNMHVIGKRRHAINTVFGNALQEIPDGRLRFSKPTLDELCNYVEMRIDSRKDTRDSDLILRLEEEQQYNTTESHAFDAGGTTSLTSIHTETAVEQTVEEMRKREQAHRESLSVMGKVKYGVMRFLHRQMRTSPAFQYIDRNHFIHHIRYYKNLNVVLPLADIVMKTQVNSSKDLLRSEKAYWICPNSPDVEKFNLEKDLLMIKEMAKK